MLFIETHIFTEDVKELLNDDEYREFQQFMAWGDVIQNTGGLRKVRWAARGGFRVIYYYKLSESQIRLLLIYKKGIRDDLSEEEKRLLRALNEGW